MNGSSEDFNVIIILRGGDKDKKKEKKSQWPS